MELKKEYASQLIDHLFDGILMVDKDGFVTFWSVGAERITGYASFDILKLHCTDSELLPASSFDKPKSKSISPLQRTLSTGKEYETKALIPHHRGHKIPVFLRTIPVRDPDGGIAGAFQVFKEVEARQVAAERILDLEEAAFFDPLTKVFNKRFLMMQLHSRLKELQRFGRGLSVLYIKIEHFDWIMTTYGDHVSDEVLKVVARTLMFNIRPFDIFGRWEDTVFMAIVLGVDDSNMEAVTNRFKRLISEAHPAIGPEEVRVSISVSGHMVTKEDTVDLITKPADKLARESSKKL